MVTICKFCGNPIRGGKHIWEGRVIFLFECLYCGFKWQRTKREVKDGTTRKHYLYS